jgi:hypothetical protein
VCHYAQLTFSSSFTFTKERERDRERETISRNIHQGRKGGRQQGRETNQTKNPVE